MINDREGPFLAAAFFCDKVLDEKDDVLSAIRIVNKITLTASSPEITLEINPAKINLMGLVSIRAGGVKGNHKIKVMSDSEILSEPSQIAVDISFDGNDDATNNVIITLGIEVKREGMIWFGVFFDDKLLTKMPLRIQVVVAQKKQ